MILIPLGMNCRPFQAQSVPHRRLPSSLKILRRTLLKVMWKTVRARLTPTRRRRPEAKMLSKRNISARQVEANRGNARRSTGPKSARGKAQSRRNSLRHGLTASAVLFGVDGVPTNSAVRRLWERLRNEVDHEDKEVDSLIEEVATEWAHQLPAVELENNRWKSAVDDGSVGIRLRSLNRHRSRSQRTLLRLLERLRQKTLP